MRSFFTLLVGVLCIFTLNAQVNTTPKPYSPEQISDVKNDVRNFRRGTNDKINPSKIQAVINDDTPIAEGYCRVIFSVGDVWGDGSGYQMLITQNEFAPNAFINANPFENYHPALYEMFEYKLPENADGTLGTNNFVFNNTLQIDIPQGYYYFGFPSPTKDRMWLAGGSFFEWNFEEKVTYSFQVIYDADLDKDNINLDVLAYGIPEMIPDFKVTPDDNQALSCLLTWTNPLLDVMEEALDDLLSVTIKRNGEIIKVFDNPVIGANESWTDNPPTDGFYTYSIYATSSVRYGPEYTAEEVVVGVNPCSLPISDFPYTEGFENEKMPYCWGIYDKDNDGNSGWRISSNTGANNSSYSVYHEDIQGFQDDWMVMPMVSLPNDGNYILRFFERINFPASYHKNSILISEGSPDPTDGDYKEIWTSDEKPLDWIERILPIKEYNGKDIYIAFRYEGNYAHYWYLDEIKIENFDLIDAEMLLIEEPITGLDLGQESVKVKIRNNGSDDIKNASVSFSVNQQLVATEVISETIPSLSEYSYTFNAKADLSEAKTHTISATITINGDEDDSNNTAQKEVRNYGPIAVMGVAPEITTCDIKFYDEGVEDKYVRGYQKSVITFVPEEAGKRLSVDFSMFDLADGFIVEDPYQGTINVRGDSLYIYEGKIMTNQFKIASLGGKLLTDDIKTFKSRSADGALTFVFDKVGNAEPGQGWEAVVKCFTPEPKELAVMKILSPTKGGNAETDVVVEVRNYGGEAITSLPIAYSLNGATPVIENAYVSIDPGMSHIYTFTTKLDLSQYNENYELEVYTMLEGDADNSNDKMTTSFFHRPSVDVYAFLSYMPPSKRINFQSNTPEQITEMNELEGTTYPYGVFYFDKHIYVITINIYTYPMTATDLIQYTPEWTEVSRVAINQQIPVIGATYDYITEQPFLSSMNLQTNTSGLYTLDMTSGAMTLIGDMGIFVGGIACNKDGELYGVTSEGKLVLIDKTTAQLTEVHQLSISNTSKGFHSLTFDLESGRLFHNNFPGVGFCEIDMTSGKVQSYGNIGDGTRSYVGMYIPYDKEPEALPLVNDSDILVYPNPTNGLVNIPNLPENAVLTLRNIAGKVVDVQYANNRNSFDYNVAEGIYLLEIRYEDKCLVKKLIIK